MTSPVPAQPPAFEPRTIDRPAAGSGGGLDYAALTLPGRRWWRPIVSALAFFGVFVVCQTVIAAGLAAYGVVAHSDATLVFHEATAVPLRITPAVLLMTNLVLASLIPSTIVAARIGQGLRPGFVHSVLGRFRWKLAAQLTVLLLPVFVVLLALRAWASGEFGAAVEPHVLAFLVIIWLTTPLQCAGEEYAFRSWFLQNIGGLFRNPVARWVVPIVPSSLLFAFIHGSLDAYVLADLAVFAAGAAIIVWITGGMEGAVVMHSLNNLLVMHLTLFFGGFQNAFVGVDTTGDLVSVLFTLVSQILFVGIAWWWAKRQRLQRLSDRDPRVAA